ncbi:MAG: GTP-binding protein [Patescibacteria group bacterium]
MALELVRITTAGSVDDGKSTLIGRLLFDCNAIFQDQLDAIKKASQTSGQEIDLSLITDGLSAEREQKITIDVAYRYFTTQKRRFIIADVPGHEQYTRNMVTGASTADIAIILVDARHGLLTQTKRHLFVASLLSIPHILVVVNKIDDVEYSQEIFEAIKKDVIQCATRLHIEDLQIMPISALRGDMVVNRGNNMNWYQGATLYDYLENVQIVSDRNLIDFRFPVQYVIRPNQNFRGYAGRVEGGIVRVGDKVSILPSGKASKIKSVIYDDKNQTEAFSGQSVVLTLTDERDISRGDMIVREQNVPEVANKFEATMCWFSEEPMQPKRSYIIKHTTRTTRGQIDTLRYRLNIDSYHREPAKALQFNEIGRVYITTSQPLMFDPYYKNRNTGAFIIIDELTNATVGAGVIIAPVKGVKVAVTKSTVQVKKAGLISGSPKFLKHAAQQLKKLGVSYEIVSAKDIKHAPVLVKLLLKHKVFVLTTVASVRGAIKLDSKTVLVETLKKNKYLI